MPQTGGTLFLRAELGTPGDVLELALGHDQFLLHVRRERRVAVCSGGYAEALRECVSDTIVDC